MELVYPSQLTGLLEYSTFLWVASTVVKIKFPNELPYLSKWIEPKLTLLTIFQALTGTEITAKAFSVNLSRAIITTKSLRSGKLLLLAIRSLAFMLRCWKQIFTSYVYFTAACSDGKSKTPRKCNQLHGQATLIHPSSCSC